MEKVFRCYVEKRPGFDGAARALCRELTEELGISSLTGVRILNRYDVEGVSSQVYAQAAGPGQGEQLGEKVRVEGTLPAGDGEAADKGPAGGKGGEHLRSGHDGDLGGGEPGAQADAGIAPGAALRRPAHPAALQRQGPRRAGGHAGAAPGAQVLGLRVVAVGAGQVAALEKDGRAAAGAVHGGEGENPVDWRGGAHTIRTFRWARRLTS